MISDLTVGVVFFEFCLRAIACYYLIPNFGDFENDFDCFLGIHPENFQNSFHRILSHSDLVLDRRIIIGNTRNDRIAYPEFTGKIAFRILSHVDYVAAPKGEHPTFGYRGESWSLNHDDCTIESRFYPKRFHDSSDILSSVLAIWLSHRQMQNSLINRKCIVSAPGKIDELVGNQERSRLNLLS